MSDDTRRENDKREIVTTGLGKSDAEVADELKVSVDYVRELRRELPAVEKLENRVY
jgi:DNA-binding CsgD family transcriptional regulator